jgi:hypothetical protein
LFCALYPLQIVNNTIRVDHETPRVFPGATCRRAASFKQPLYRLFKEELMLVLGEDGYRQLAASVAGDG